MITSGLFLSELVYISFGKDTPKVRGNALDKNINVIDLMASHEEVSSIPLGEGKLRIDRGSLAGVRMPVGHFWSSSA